MAKGAVTKLQLDTDQAHRDLKELAREGEATAGRVNRKGGSTGGQGGSFGKGFSAGAGFALGKRVASSVGFFSAVGDVASDALSGVQADVDYSLGAQVSRARKSAREETVSQMAFQAYHSGSTDSSKQFFNSILRNRHQPREEGAARIMQATGGTRGLDSDNKTKFDEFTERAVDEIKTQFQKILETLGG